MKLEKEVCSLKCAKQLKELGVKQDSLFYFIVNKEKQTETIQYCEDPIVEFITCEDDFDKIPYIDDILNNEEWSDWKNDENLIICSAFTVAELGEMLPGNLIINNKKCWLRYMKDGKNIQPHEIDYFCFNDQCSYFTQNSLTESDVRAKMLIYLLENNLIKIEEFNNE